MAVNNNLLLARYELEHNISGLFDFNDIIKNLIDTSCKLMNVEACSIVLLNPLTKKLKFHFVEGVKKKELIGFSMNMDKGIVGWTISNNKHLIVNDASNDPRFYSNVDKKTGFETRNIFAIPLNYNGYIIGAIEFINRKEGKPFSEKEDSFFIDIADHIALILHNSKNFLKKNNEKRLAVVGTMSSMIVHEIHNPLSIIRGYAELLLEDNIQKNEKEKYLNKVISEVDRLNVLTKKILSLSKDTKQNFHISNMNSVIRECIEMFEKEMKKKKIKFNFIEDKTISDFLFSEDGIKQVFINLIRNAIDAMDDIYISKELIISTENLEDSVKINVKNSYDNIDNKLLENIFEPFYSTKKKGNGLGLTVVKKIITEHSGSIDIVKDNDKIDFLIIIPIKN